MKQSFGIYLLAAGILMGVYLLFGVYVPSQLKAFTPAPVTQQDVAVVPVSDIDLAPEVKPDSDLALENPPVVPTKEPAPVNEPVQVAKEAAPEPIYTDLPEEPVVEKVEKPKKGSKSKNPFDVPSGLKAEVDFWIKIYSKYTNDQAVLHDPENLGKVYGVISLPHCDEPPTKECLKLREDKIQDEKDKILDNGGHVFHDKDLVPTIRAQVGQKNKFQDGIIASRKFLPRIEKIFAEYGVPKEVSRLPFVESMFNTKAYSRSRAAGIWQLMPATAKIFGLRVTKKVDERYDPVKSTYAAAKHLLRDYNRLGSWSLAINAYNAGPGRLADAIDQVGTGDIAKIIKNYYHPAYGFAARNFYPCFLAALDVYENRNEYFGKKKTEIAEGK